MPLPILRTSAADLLRLFHKTEVDWTRPLADETALDVGTAFVNASLPAVAEANRILDAVVPAGISPRDAVRLALRHFEGMKSTCGMWLPSPSAGGEPADAALRDAGFESSPDEVWRYSGGAAPPPDAGDLVIIPARASFRHAQQLADEAGPTPAHAAAHMLHLDDPHFDALIALRDGVAVGSAGVLAVGEVGHVDGVFVSRAFRRRGVAALLLARVIDICERSQFRHVLASAAPDNPAATATLRAAGFQKIGSQPRYIRRDHGKSST